MYSVKDLHKYSHDLKILYVEDDEKLRTETETLFNMLFKDVDTAEDGSIGLKKFNDNVYDLVISDINMPNMNGTQMVTKIREINPEQKVLIVSAHDESTILIDLIQAGADGFILKPMHMDELVTALYPVCRDAYTQIVNIQLIEELNQKNALLEEQNRELQARFNTIETKHQQVDTLLQQVNKPEISQGASVPNFPVHSLKNEAVDDYFKEDEDDGVEKVLFLSDHCADLSEIFTYLPEVISKFERDNNIDEIHSIVQNLHHASSIFMYYSPYLDTIATSFTQLATAIEENMTDLIAILHINSEGVLMLFDAVSSDIERYIERFQVESLAMKNSHHIHEPTALSIQQIISLILPPQEESDTNDIFDF